MGRRLWESVRQGDKDRDTGPPGAIKIDDGGLRHMFSAGMATTLPASKVLR